jgi:hypothetical protein
LDLVVGAWILAAELVAREADDGEFVTVRGFKIFVKDFEAFELRCEAGD